MKRNAQSRVRPVAALMPIKPTPLRAPPVPTRARRLIRINDVAAMPKPAGVDIRQLSRGILPKVV